MRYDPARQQLSRPHLSVMLFACGVQLLILGIIGEYIGRLMSAAYRRPVYIVEEIARNEGYPLVYLAQYLFGSALLYEMVAWLGIDRRWAALIALLLSVPMSFLLNRLVLAQRATP